jgi:multidrug efflux pump subunit AcrA (membrane-fusion protein)
MLSEHNPELLRQIQIDELVLAISPWTKLGGIVLIGTCGLAVLLAAIVKYPITVRSPATIRPTGELRIIEASPPTNSNLGVLPYYEVTIQPDRLHLTKGNQSYAIQSGMEVTADIISKQETVLTFILRKARLLTNL